MSRKLENYSTLFSRKKVFVPVAPPGIELEYLVYGPNSPTTTTHMSSAGSPGGRLVNINSQNMFGAQMAAQNDEVVLNWRIPDDMYAGEAVHVWALWAPNHVSTTTATMSYDVKYAAYKIADYDSSLAYTPEAIDEGDTAMDTDLDESVAFSTGSGAAQVTQYAIYRSMRGTINGGNLDQQDFVSFKFELDAAPTEGSSMYFIGFEIDYALRVRERGVENLT